VACLLENYDYDIFWNKRVGDGQACDVERPGEEYPLVEEQLVGRGAPSWINCELCKCQRTHWQARFVIAEDQTAGRASPELAELVLLCADCSAVAEGAIDASEWKRRKTSIEQ
jgi:hypothetical protein